ncbi:hypothetical protein, partial [Parageobacillus toebii]|uniref:hypothetical protein n=1 Tax=Parageobacillus toebii TaxID=153151 RepID=UPI0035B54C87
MAIKAEWMHSALFSRRPHFYVYFPFQVDHVRMIFGSSCHSLVSNDARPVYCFFDDVSNDDHMRM